MQYEDAVGQHIDWCRRRFTGDDLPHLPGQPASPSQLARLDDQPARATELIAYGIEGGHLPGHSLARVRAVPTDVRLPPV